LDPKSICWHTFRIGAGKCILKFESKVKGSVSSGPVQFREKISITQDWLVSHNFLALSKKGNLIRLTSNQAKSVCIIFNSRVLDNFLSREKNKARKEMSKLMTRL
jgi:hypothetical protein